MRKIILLLFCFLVVHAHSQEQIIYQKSTTEKYLVRYKSSSDPNQLILNRMFSELAKYLNRTVYNLEFSFSHKQNIRIYRAGSHISVDIDFLDFTYDSELYYKQFNLASQFIPPFISFTGKLYKSDQIISSYSVNKTPINGNKRFNFNYIDSSLSTRFTFKILQKEFFYETDEASQLTAYLNLIDDYYTWDSKFRLAINDLDIMNPKDPDQLEYNNNLLTQMQGLILDFDRSEIISKLGLKEHDPIQVLNRVDYLDIQLIKAREAVAYTYSILHEIYFRRGLEAMLADDSQMARSFFMRSLDANHSFAPALFQLASMDFSDGHTADAAERISHLFRTMEPDPDTRLLAIELAQDIYEDFINESISRNENGDYNDALKLLEDLELYCSELYVINCTDEIYKNRSIAHGGIYRDLINESKQYLQKGNLQAADEYIDEAITYQKKNNQYITDQNEAMLVKTNIAQVRYDQLINQGKEYLENGNHTLAFDQFREAKSMEDQYNLSLQSELELLLKKASKPIILDYLKKGEEYVKLDKIEKARQFLKKAKDIQNQYFPSPDKEIQSQINKLQNEIFDLSCMNAEKAYNSFVLSALDMSEILQYNEADKLLQQAIEECRNQPDCQLDYSEAVKEQERIKPASSYQRKIEAAIQYKEKSNYNQAISTYNEAGSYFSSKAVGSFGLNHKSTLDFILMGDNHFVKYGITHFINADEPAHALTLMQELKQRGYHFKFLKNEQKALGEKLAIADADSGLMGNPKELVMNYSQGNKWYKYLAKSYKKKFKKVRKK